MCSFFSSFLCSCVFFFGWLAGVCLFVFISFHSLWVRVFYCVDINISARLIFFYSFALLVALFVPMVCVCVSVCEKRRIAWLTLAICVQTGWSRRSFQNRFAASSSGFSSYRSSFIVSSVQFSNEKKREREKFPRFWFRIKFQLRSVD